MKKISKKLSFTVTTLSRMDLAHATGGVDGPLTMLGTQCTCAPTFGPNCTWSKAKCSNYWSNCICTNGC